MINDPRITTVEQSELQTSAMKDMSIIHDDKL